MHANQLAIHADRRRAGREAEHRALAGRVAFANQRRDAIGDESRDVLVVVDDDGANAARRWTRRAQREKARDRMDRGPLSSLTTASRRAPATDRSMLHLDARVLGGERAAAAAAARGVRVLEGEAGALHRRDVVDRDAVQVLRRERIDEHAPFALVDDEVVFGGLVFDEEAVLEAAAAAGLDAHAKAALGRIDVLPAP